MKTIKHMVLLLLIVCFLIGCEEEKDSKYSSENTTKAPTLNFTVSEDQTEPLQEPGHTPTDPQDSTQAELLPTEAIPASEPASANTVPATEPPVVSETEPPVVSATEPPVTETVPPSEPNDDDFVMIADYLSNAYYDLRYATQNNFTGQIIYDFEDAWLRYGTVKKLVAVQEEVSKDGYRLLIWDGFRPVSAQFTLWEVCPDATYVANPNKGFSSHSRGNTVDLTLVYADGTPVEMPTEFDDFSRLADRDYGDCTPEAAENATYLETIMEKHGFTGYSGEWWHFSDTQSYPVGENFEPADHTSVLEGE